MLRKYNKQPCVRRKTTETSRTGLYLLFAYELKHEIGVYGLLGKPRSHYMCNFEMFVFQSDIDEIYQLAQFTLSTSVYTCN